MYAVREVAPEVFAEVKASHLRATITWELSGRVLHMSEIGLIEENEMDALLEAARRVGRHVEKVWQGILPLHAHPFTIINHEIKL